MAGEDEETISFWKNIVHTNKLIKYQNRGFDTIAIFKLETEPYQTRPKYQVNFNKYILGIFRRKHQALGFAKLWMKSHV
jgi:hypothetical protein